MPPAPDDHRTLVISQPFGATFAYAILSLLLLGLVAEVVLRLPAVQAALPAPSLDSAHRHIDRKIPLLNAFVAQHGAPDCIFIGNSTTHRGIDPAVVSAGYAAEMSQPLNCFNLGLAGLTAGGAAQLLPIIIHEYQPAMIVIGVNLRDVVVENRQRFDALFSGSWYTLHAGRFTLKGWLVQHSLAVRYLLYVSDWIYPGPVGQKFGPEPPFSEFGFGREGQEEWDRTPPQELLELFASFSIAPAWTEALEEVARVAQAAGASLVFVEMPLPSLDGLSDPGANYQAYVEQVQGIARVNNALFLPSQNANLISADGWADYGHLNLAGATVFSCWLGHQLAQAVSYGQLPNPHTWLR